MPSKEALPVSAASAEIARRIRSEHRLVLVAETGSGKTTQVPQILVEHGCAGDGQIVVLQPRRLAARSVARRVAAEMGVPLGGLVGFRTRYEREDSKDTRILFMTDGLFVRIAQGSAALDGIDAVVMDEFHERSIATDLSAGFVRRLQRSTRPDLSAIVMSATIDAARLGESFGCDPLHIAGRCHEVTISHLGDTPRGGDVAQRAAEAVQAAVKEHAGDALVFMPGRREIQWTIEALERCGLGGEFETLALHGSQRAEEQDRALAPSARRKIVVATNIAETSLTIPGVTIVVDSGLARIHRFDPVRDLNALRVEPISQASARQRAGRAGRTAPGLCLRLWSDAAERRRAAFDTPEIHRIDLSEALLFLASIGETRVGDFPWIDQPGSEALSRATRVLRACGAFDEAGSLSPLGRSMARIPAHPRVGRALIEAFERGCLDRAALWAAILTERDAAERADPEWLRHQMAEGDLPGDLVARERALVAFERGGRNSPLDRDAARETLRAADDLHRAARSTTGGRRSSEGSRDSDADLAASFLLGFPDRVAWRLDRHRPHAAMGDRRRVSISRRSLHEGEGPLLAFDVDHTGTGDATETSLSMTASIRREWLEATIPDRLVHRVEERWEGASQSVEEVEEVLFDSAVIESTRRPPRNLVVAGRLIAAEMAAGRLVSDDWEGQALPWIARVRWVARTFPEQRLLAYEPDDLAVIFAEIAAGASRWSQVRARPTRDALANALSYEDRTFVERMAPAHLKLPGGFSMKVDYDSPQGPRGRAKIQDFYGLDETPRVGGGRSPVLLEILGPNYRPLQVTADLAGFWKNLYPELRNELRRRYPRHRWI